MKAILFLSTILMLAFLSGCQTQKDPTALLENTETRNEIMTAISGNHDYMMELMNIMSENDHALQMMRSNEKMMGQMMQGNRMRMMGQDSMMQQMMKDGQMMGHMMQMMHNEGMMSEECMQSFKSRMAAKGMDMKGMGAMNGSAVDSVEQGHSTHH